MHISVKTILILVITVAYTGCQGNAPETNTTPANNNSSMLVNSNNTLAANGEPLQPADNGETKEIADGLPVPVNANVILVNTNQTKDTMKEMPAPDDSTFSAEMNGKGQPVETRTFKSHPVLAKVEKITMSPRDYVFKIYLKNGKVVESKSDQLKDFRVISPLNILDVIGMKPPPPKPDPNAPKPEDMKKPIMIPKASP